MSKNKQPNSPVSEQELLDYLEGKTKGVEANRIEKHILSSAFEEEAFEGLSEHPVNQIKEDFHTLRERLGRKQIYHQPGFMNIAATITFLIAAFGSIWFVVNNALPGNEISMKSTEEPLMSEEMVVADSSATQPEETVDLEPLVAESEPIVAEDQEDVQELPVAEEVAEEDTELEPADIADSESDQAGDIAVAGQLAFNDQENEITEPEAVSPVEAEVPVSNDQVGATADDLPESEQAKKSLAAPSQARSAVTTEEAQAVRGTVYYREDGEPLIGIQVSGDGMRTVSELNGQFELTGIGIGSILSFSGQGLVSKEVSIENNEPVNVVLAPAATAQKAVIIGYDNIVNKSPEPINGRNAFREYVSSSLQYPEEASSQQIEGVVVLKVTISSDGTINNIEVKKSLSASCDQEAVRLIEEGPKWSPATYNGDPVEGAVRVRIIFDL